jgi:hypothetical protein
MKHILAVALFVLALMPASAQLLTVTATGTISVILGQFDPSVQIGGAFTETFTLDTQTLSSSGTGIYSNTDDPLAVASETFGDYAPIHLGSVSATVVPYHASGYLSGYSFASNPNSSVGARLYLFSDNPAVAPTNAFSNIQQFPISYFDDTLAIYTDNSTDYNKQIQANITSFTLTNTAVPEPSGIYLAGLGLLIFLVKSSLARSRRQLVS